MMYSLVFLPGESQGWQRLLGCRLWGHTESDMTSDLAAAQRGAVVPWSFKMRVTMKTRSVVDQGEGIGGRMEWEVGVSRYKLFYKG